MCELRCRRASSLLGALCVTGLIASPGALGTSSSAQQAQEWVLSTPPELNPFKKQLPPEMTGGAASPTHIDFGTTRPPQAKFNIDFDPPPPKVEPGGKITFKKVTVEGKLVGEMDKIGARRAEPILLVNDRWGGTSITRADVGCAYAPGGVKIECTKSDSNTEPASTTAPTSGNKFTVGIGVLNCGPCYVRFTYTRPNAAPTKQPTPPVVQAFAPHPTALPGRTVRLEYSVKDDSGRANAHLDVYQGGDRVLQQSNKSKADGKRRALFFHLPKTLVGPLFFCVWATNTAGLRSPENPKNAKSSCAWIPFRVPIGRVSNACGSEDSWWPLWLQHLLGNKHTYDDERLGLLHQSYTVSFVKACNLHDAGYAGVMVWDAINGGDVNYRTWSRARVDAKFRDDMIKLCKKAIPPRAKIARAKCTGRGGPASYGALALYNAVRKYGKRGFDHDLTTSGVQAFPLAYSGPKGGARSE